MKRLHSVVTLIGGWLMITVVPALIVVGVIWGWRPMALYFAGWFFVLALDLVAMINLDQRIKRTEAQDELDERRNRG
jgi:hypothetical protein